MSQRETKTKDIRRVRQNTKAKGKGKHGTRENGGKRKHNKRIETHKANNNGENNKINNKYKSNKHRKCNKNLICCDITTSLSSFNEFDKTGRRMITEDECCNSHVLLEN